jgi:hypothetical protein
MDKSGLPNLYPWPPKRYLHEMHAPDFSEFRLLKAEADDAAQRAA